MKNYQMERLGTLQMEDKVFHVFFDNLSYGIDYFFLNEESNQVDCILLKISDIKDVFPSFKKMDIKVLKTKYNSILTKVILLDDVEIASNIIKLQSFDIELWENGVLKDFEDIEWSLI